MLAVSALLDPGNPLSAQLMQQFPSVFSDLVLISHEVNAEIRIIDDLLTVCRSVNLSGACLKRVSHIRCLFFLFTHLPT